MARTIRKEVLRAIKPSRSQLVRYCGDGALEVAAVKFCRGRGRPTTENTKVFFMGSRELEKFVENGGHLEFPVVRAFCPVINKNVPAMLGWDSLTGRPFVHVVFRATEVRHYV